MKKQYERIAGITFFSILALLLPTMVQAQAVEESAVSKFSNWLSEFSKEISGQVSGGANGAVKGRVFGFAQGLMGIVFLIVAFMQIFGVMKGEGKELDRWFWGKMIAVLALIIFSRVFTASATGILLGVKNAAANVITLTDDNENVDKMLGSYRETVSKAIEDNYKKNASGWISTIGASVERSSQKIVSSIYYWIIELLLMLYELACFFTTVFADFLVQLLVVFFPLVLTLSFLPGFSQGVTQYLKYILSLCLWPMIVGVLKMIAQAIGFANILGQLQGVDVLAKAGNLDISNLISFTAILALVVMIFMIVMTPMISDMLISGSQSGGFFSSTVGKATALTGGGMAILSGVTKNAAAKGAQSTGNVIGGGMMKAGASAGRKIAGGSSPTSQAITKILQKVFK
jgi:hypothetical protein